MFKPDHSKLQFSSLKFQSPNSKRFPWDFLPLRFGAWGFDFESRIMGLLKNELFMLFYNN